MPTPGFRPRPILLLAAGAIVALTCDDAPRDVALADEIAQAFCAHQFACCAPIEISALSSDRYTTQDACVVFAKLAALQQLGTVNGAIAQGRITVDPARAAACMTTYRDRACNVSQQMLAPPSALPIASDVFALCPDLLVGHVPEGQACVIAQECLPGSRCVTGASSGISGMTGTGGIGGPISLTGTPGVCVHYQELGQPCNDNSDCDPSLACRTPQFQCGPRNGEGEPCVPQFDPISGLQSDGCDASKGLFCDPSFLVCRRYPRDGEPCSQVKFPQCDPDPALALSCVSFTGICKAPGNEGDVCGGSAIPPCRADLACHPTQSDGIGTCGPLPSAGERCVDRCATPAVCVGSTCTLPGSAPTGAPCSAITDCASLVCSSSLSGSPQQVCAPTTVELVCAGADVSPGINVNVTGVGGIGGTIGTGTAGAGGSSSGGRGPPPPTGTAGSTGSGGFTGCLVSNPDPTDPLIADFSDPMGAVPIGGTFTYAAPSMSPAPIATVTGGAWHVTLDAPGLPDPQFLGAGIFFIGNPPNVGCIDATVHTGVRFDVSGEIAGPGCTAQYATNDSIHTDGSLDPKGSGPSGAFAPQVNFSVTAAPETLMIPFVGAGGPTGGNPLVPLDKSKLTGVQWQFTVAAGPENSCHVDVTIDNVMFF
jgi:hypothetical protein